MAGQAPGATPPPYVFNAGQLRGKRVTEISDEELGWALQFNKEYCSTFADPTATTRWNGRTCLVAQLPAGVAARRVRLSAAALLACREESASRMRAAQGGAEAFATTAMPTAFDPDVAPQGPQATGQLYRLAAMAGELQGLLSTASALCTELTELAHAARRGGGHKPQP